MTTTDGIDYDAQADALFNEVEAAIEGAKEDMGEEIVEAGGWSDIAFAIIDMSPAPLQVKAEVIRREGLTEYRAASKYLPA
jgi:hypothetical protein